MPNTPNYFVVSNPTFAPQMFNILSITNATIPTITTTTDGINPANHNYLTGLIVRIVIPVNFGMSQLDQFEGPITVTSPSTFTINFNTSSLQPFVVPSYQPGNNGTPAQVVPIGETNDILTMAVMNILPPQV